MRFRKLRIAWSVGWGIACVLLVVLWLLNFAHGVSGQLPKRNFGMSSVNTPLNGFLRTYATNAGLQMDTSGVPAETLAEPINMPYTGDPKGVLEQLHDKTGLYFSINKAAGASTLSITTQPNLGIRGLFYGALATCIVLAVTPWIRWRFSLRTLLLITTLVAVVLGLVVWTAQH